MITTTKQNRFAELDFVRAIALIGVVAIHVTGITLTKVDSNSITLDFSLIINQLSRFCVPAFLFVSGILAYHSNKSNNYLGLIKRKVNDLVIPYIIWTILGMLLFLDYSINYKGIFMTLVTGNGPFYQLYYIPLLFQMFVVLPILMKLNVSIKSIFLLSGLTLLLFISYQVIMSKGILQFSPEIILKSSLFAWVIYFVSGIAAAQNYTKLLEFIKSKPTYSFVMVYIISSIFLIVEAFINHSANKTVELLEYFRVTVFFYSFSSIGLLMKIGLNYHTKFLSKIYINSFGIYLVHVAIIKVLLLISLLFFSKILFIIINILLTILISYWVVELLKRTPASFLLFGQRHMVKSK
ncbi:acyltransferase [Paenibacillus eucommiae]|uniref:Surface polysaccharide O-acyltransferase-like enzyme n=1 Tax=Paenibacillus eucommiae TaxID=1355755 RepID=A0ABS4ITM7_9BACL|nr:acyltransferase [Paenibacillus eucommiae]MBP1990376.1 surface polysaccharide O-acyltransferase-like enzyme [Paenibacillus eucommiae]